MEKIIPKFDNNIGICLYSDNYYVPYLGVAVFSMIANKAKDTFLDILIFENGYTDDNKKRIIALKKDDETVSIRFIDLKPFIDDLKVSPSKHVSINCFAKIFCTNEIFSEYDKMLVFDSDLVIKGDLKELMTLELGSNLIASVKDTLIPIMLKYGYHVDERLGYIRLDEYFNKIGIDRKDYINTGVVLFNIKKCQENDIEKKFISVNEKYPAMMYPAQDDFNIIFSGKCLFLDLMWNYQNPYALYNHISEFSKDYLQYISDAKIVHFLGKSKPWNDKKCLNGDYFWKYAEKTEWFKEIDERRIAYEKKNFFNLRVIPKGSRRRIIALKIKFFLKRLFKEIQGK